MPAPFVVQAPVQRQPQDQPGTPANLSKLLDQRFYLPLDSNTRFDPLSTLIFLYLSKDIDSFFNKKYRDLIKKPISIFDSPPLTPRFLPKELQDKIELKKIFRPILTPSFLYGLSAQGTRLLHSSNLQKDHVKK